MIGEEWATIQSREKSNTLRPIYRPFNDDEQIRIQNTLDQSIEPEYIQFRPSPQGSVAYVEGWKALSLANETFGFNGWSSEILHLNPDFVDISSDGRVSLGISCMVRIHLRDGTFHDDIGYGIAENHKTKGGAWEKARKEAVTDAMKRALRMFGSRLGNCAYDKAFLRQVKNGPPKRALVTNNNNTGGNMNNPTNNHNRADTIPLSKQQTPSDYAPSWKHPKTAPTETIITAPTAPVRGINHSATTSIPPTTNTTSATSEADSEPVVTEERTFSRTCNVYISFHYIGIRVIGIRVIFHRINYS